MSPSSIAGVQVENHFFPPTVTPPESNKRLFLGGAGDRGLTIEGNFVKFTAIGVYLQPESLPSLAAKWKGKPADDLAASDEFFHHVITSNFDKLVQVTMIRPLIGSHYAEKVTDNCIEILKSTRKYAESEKNAVEKFIGVFKDENFQPGSSIILTMSPLSFTISFSGDGSVPGSVKLVIQNGLLGEAILESIIGKHGVSPDARKNLAKRMSEILQEDEVKLEQDVKALKINGNTPEANGVQCAGK